MTRSLAFKLAGIGVLIVLLLFALSSIEHVVAERQERRDAVTQDIARSSSGEQQLAGPVLIVPYVRTVRQWREDARGRRHLETNMYAGQLWFLPQTFRLEGEVRTERRARGIYEARLYHAKLRIRAEFATSPHYGLADSALVTYRFEQPFIAVGVTDIRGIESPLTASLNDAPVTPLPGTGTTRFPGGFHAAVSTVAPDKAAHLQLVIDLPLLGTSALNIVPVGRQTQIDLKSNWPHPSFGGDFLPAEHTIDANGFSARWATSFFATNLEEVMNRCGDAESCPDFTGHQLGVNFVDPIDQYLETDRAIKYALLFITLTFAAFFLFDVLKRLPVHWIQYGLVGMALALFYLLLLSLAEHIGFGAAYLLSSAACIGLIAFYVSHVLRSIARGLAFGGGLAVLYACLFGLLAAEDYALLMGSTLLFAALAAVMVITRNVNWSQIGAPETSRWLSP